MLSFNRAHRLVGWSCCFGRFVYRCVSLLCVRCPLSFVVCGLLVCGVVVAVAAAVVWVVVVCRDTLKTSRVYIQKRPPCVRAPRTHVLPHTGVVPGIHGGRF